MLTATLRYWTDDLGRPTIVGYDNQALHLEDLLVHISRLATRPALQDAEINGHRAWLTVTDPGYILHAHFGEASIDFEWHPQQRGGRPEVLSGTLPLEVLQEVLGMLDGGQDPGETLSHYARRG